MTSLIEAVHQLSTDVRYVAIYIDGQLESSTKPGLVAASSSESDNYEELIVNPTLLTLLTQRGNIDCGGLQYVIIHYGNFFEYVASIRGGHISVGIDQHANPIQIARAIQTVVHEWTTG